MTHAIPALADHVTSARVAVDAGDARIAGLALCGASLLLPEVPGYPGLTCPLRASTGIPCPLCGLTSSVRALLTLDVGASLALSPLGLAAVLGAGAALLSRRPRLELPGVLILAAFTLSWIYQLFRFSAI